jgi:hypothetical protein
MTHSPIIVAKLHHRSQGKLNTLVVNANIQKTKFKTKLAPQRFLISMAAMVYDGIFFSKSKLFWIFIFSQ